MYFFLHNLSFVDIVYTSVTILNMLSGFLTETKTISVPGCFLQMYWFISMAVTGRGLLTVMAFDRYAAICNPLRYTAIMTRKPPVVALLTTLALILSSYAAIDASICRMGSWEVRRKAFTTCAAHLTVVFISYGSAAFVYTSYRVGNFSPDVRIVVATLYSALTPLLNPVIYSLRNKELRDAVRRMFRVSAGQENRRHGGLSALHTAFFSCTDHHTAASMYSIQHTYSITIQQH
ncbi:hypothetical protein SKAU_G00326330 [Synaphobranchus kaupii]|uniref:G-protein coupled receptors family 1 profile domain-containing protein n=1 Tax=Synaphobranchus kaupii TaxID=118154 RepID=A0A9Q1IJB9_SYNKA|nr:hypothetical protein SKAU_G00326330 [Synaphobranchus kaupii]